MVPASLAQLVEQRIRNAQVEGSNPLRGSERRARDEKCSVAESRVTNSYEPVS